MGGDHHNERWAEIMQVSPSCIAADRRAVRQRLQVTELREAVARLGWRQADLAAAEGVSISRAKDWLEGKGVIPTEVLHRVVAISGGDVAGLGAA